jgi:chromosome segregation ATPase
MHIQHSEFLPMNIDEDTCGWLGIPTPLEMHKQHARLLENEIQELNLQLRKARADIFGLVEMLAEAQAKKDEFAGYLKQRGAEAAAMRKQINDLTTSSRADQRRADQLKELLDGLVTRPKTIV